MIMDMAGRRSLFTNLKISTDFMTNPKRVVTFLALAFVTVLTSYAQDFPTTTDAQYINQFARPGRPTITVHIWGAVSSPGLWRVEEDIDLIPLLSAAGVPAIGVDDANTKQTIMLKIYREDDRGHRQEIYLETLEKVLNAGGTYPTLENGDILHVITKTRAKLSYTTVMATIASLAATALLLIRLRDMSSN